MSKHATSHYINQYSGMFGTRGKYYPPCWRVPDQRSVSRRLNIVWIIIGHEMRGIHQSLTMMNTPIMFEVTRISSLFANTQKVICSIKFDFNLISSLSEDARKPQSVSAIPVTSSNSICVINRVFLHFGVHRLVSRGFTYCIYLKHLVFLHWL